MNPSTTTATAAAMAAASALANHATLLYKPIPLGFNSYFFNQNELISIAGSNINADDKVYLVYEMPISVLAKRFDETKTEKLEISVSDGEKRDAHSHFYHLYSFALLYCCHSNKLTLRPLNFTALFFFF